MEGSDNIVLNYRVKIYTDSTSMETVLVADKCEFFLDEHGFQWVKFKAWNGYEHGKEHMLRTENIMVVRDDA